MNGKRRLRWTMDRTTWLAGLWGLAEATFLFIVPDVLLGWVALRRGWKSTVTALVATLAGALLGGTIWYLLAAAAQPGTSAALLARIPGIHAPLVDQVQATVEAKGGLALVLGPTSGIPYKLYARASGLLHMPFLSFLLWSIPARLERLLGVAVLGALVHRLGGRWIERFPRLTALGYLLAWGFIYVAYFKRFGW